jgi:DNA repair exonuclease SbcCD ATPase subunit
MVFILFYNRKFGFLFPCFVQLIMGSSRFLLFFFFFFAVCSVALLEAAAPVVSPQKKVAAAKEEVVVITTPEVHAAAATNDRSDEVIAALREEIGRKDKKVSTLEAQLHALEAKLKTTSAPAVGGGNGNPEKLRSLEETIRTQQIEIRSLKEEVASLKKTAGAGAGAGAGASAGLGSALEWLEKEYNNHLPKDWKEKLQETSEAKLADLSHFLHNDLRPLLLQHKQTALLKGNENTTPTHSVTMPTHVIS